MGIQVIHYENYLLSCWIFDHEKLFYMLRPIDPRSMFTSVGHAPPFQWFGEQKNTTGILADIFGILSLRLSFFHGDTLPSISQQLDRLFIHAYHRTIDVIRPAIHFQNIFHGGNETTVVLGRNTPALFQVRLTFVFFNVRLMVIGEMEAIIPNSTHLSASKRTVHRAYPSGGVLQHKAIICASTSPVTFGVIGGVARFFLWRNKSSDGLCRNASLITCIVCLLT
jgi:hypothetical protein